MGSQLCCNGLILPNPVSAAQESLADYRPSSFRHLTALFDDSSIQRLYGPHIMWIKFGEGFDLLL